ncbi:hypothetical protein CSPX01_13651 [Colletotrichum filicis]|nr:hypothetical protein CSPX01_13651 [Colletotrichum filicis]
MDRGTCHGSRDGAVFPRLFAARLAFLHGAPSRPTGPQTLRVCDPDWISRLHAIHHDPHRLRHTMPWMPLTHGPTVVPPPPTNGSAHSTGQSRRTSLTSSLLIRQPTIDYSAPSLHLDS